MDHYLSGVLNAAQFGRDVGHRRGRWTLEPPSHMTSASSSAGFFFSFLPWNTMSPLSCPLFVATGCQGELLNLQGALFVSWHPHEW